jgi:hypothetical protein
MPSFHVNLSSVTELGRRQDWYIQKSERKTLSLERPWRPKGVWDVENPKLSTQSVHTWRIGRHSYAPAALCPQKYLLVLISVRFWVNYGAMVRLERLGKLKITQWPHRVWIPQLPASSIAPQPSTLSCVPTFTFAAHVTCNIATPWLTLPTIMVTIWITSFNIAHSSSFV